MRHPQPPRPHVAQPPSAVEIENLVHAGGDGSCFVLGTDVSETEAASGATTHECLTHCDGSFMIPQVGMVQSLNISVACAVSLYEAFRQRQAKGYYDGQGRLSAAEKADLSQQWGLYEETNITQKSS